MALEGFGFKSDAGIALWDLFVRRTEHWWTQSECYEAPVYGRFFLLSGVFNAEKLTVLTPAASPKPPIFGCELPKIIGLGPTAVHGSGNEQGNSYPTRLKSAVLIWNAALQSQLLSDLTDFLHQARC